MTALNMLLMDAIAESTGAAPIVPIPATGFATGPDYTTNWVGLTTPTSAISQQGDFVRLQAGPTLANGDAEHCQLISKLRCPAQFRLIADIVVRDSSAGSTTFQEACLLYFAMSGDTASGYDSDLTKWITMDGAAVSGSTRFETHSFGFRMSFDPLDPGGSNNDQIRLRQANATGDLNLVTIIGTGTPNTQPGSFPYITGKTYRVTITHDGQQFTFKYKNTTDNLAEVILPAVSHVNLDDYNVGQFIFRAMGGRTFDVNIISVDDISGGVSPPPIVVDPTDELPPEDPLKTARVTTLTQFKDALLASDSGRLAGWTIYVDPPAGTVWDGTIPITKRTGAGAPCVFRTAGPGDVTLTGNLWFGDDDTAPSAGSIPSGILLWGFKRRGTAAISFFRGTNNHLRRMDISGWQAGQAINVLGDGLDCSIWHHTFHDPAGWTQAERDNWTNNKKTALRMGIRHNGVSPTNYMNRLHLYSIDVYNFPTKIDPLNYSSAQDDFTEPSPDVDNCAGYKPVLLVNWCYEKILIEDTHLQGVDATGKKAKGAATFDVKAGGVTVRKSTMLMPGRLDIRGNGGTVFEDIYTETSLAFSGGGPTNIPSNYPDAPANRVSRINCVAGQWGKPSLKLLIGNAPPNGNQGDLGLTSGMYQQVKNMILEDIWGGGITVGDTTDEAPTFPPDGTIIRRWEGTTINTPNQTNTTQIAGAPQGTKPTKQTRQICGFTADYVAPDALPWA